MYGIKFERHKTVIRACRSKRLQNGRGVNNGIASASLNESASTSNTPTNQNSKAPLQLGNDDIGLLRDQNLIGVVRTVRLKKSEREGLGISITGGQEHGVPILISDIHENGPAIRSGELFIGDAILSVNDTDLREVMHSEAVKILSSLVSLTIKKIF